MEVNPAHVKNGNGRKVQMELVSPIAPSALEELPLLRDFESGQNVDAPFLLVEHEMRARRNGEPFLRMRLADSSGSVPAIMWEPDSDAEFAVGQVVHVGGSYSVHDRYGPQVTVRDIRQAGEDVDLARLMPSPDRPVGELVRDLEQLIATVREPCLKALLEVVLGPRSRSGELFRTAPAARFYHEAYRHGLLAHTLSVARGVDHMSGMFAGVDRDIALTGALLHDLGKTEEYIEAGLAYEQSSIGKLCGHIPLGYYSVRRAIEDIGEFPPDLAAQVLHIILSHHGSLENGSPVVPMTREASLVHYVDNLAGQQGNFNRVELTLERGANWSARDRAIGGPAYFPQRDPEAP